MDAVIGIDIGTRSSKGVVCRGDGSVLAQAQIDHGVSIPHPGQMEHDADGVWWNDVVVLSRRLMAAIPTGTSIVALGVSAIGPCLLPVDAAGRPLRPGILYGADARATSQIAGLEARFGSALTRLSGGRLTSQAVGPKILWLLENEPDVFAKTATLLTSTAYVVFKLTGSYAIDHHNASYFAPFYDLRKARWDLRFAEGAVPPDMLPELRWASEVVGRVTPEAAAVTGVPAGTPVTAGTTDGAAEAIGTGVLQRGDLMISYGSTSALVLVLDQLRTAGGVWATRGSWPDESVATAALSTSGSITSWFREQFARELPQTSFEEMGATHAALCREAEASPIGANGILMLPYFSGERSPFSDPLARGVIAGLTLSHDRGDIYRAIMEATAFGLRHNLEAMTKSGTTVRRAVAAGGGTTSRLWLQIVSDVTGLTQELPDRAVGAALGDAYIAATSVGLTERALGMTGGWAKIVDRVAPDPEHARYGRTRAIVHALAQEAQQAGGSRLTPTSNKEAGFEGDASSQRTVGMVEPIRVDIGISSTSPGWSNSTMVTPDDLRSPVK
jgi:xylulokinase